MSNYRILWIGGMPPYPTVQRSFYNNRPGLVYEPYELQQKELVKLGTIYSDGFSRAMRLLGNDASEIFFDVEILQKTWAKEHGVSYGEKTWSYDILISQIKYIRPDVIYFQSVIPLPGFIRRNLKREFPFVKLTAIHFGWPVHEYVLKDIDVLLPAAPFLRERCRRMSRHSHLVYLAFDDAILQLLGPGESQGKETYADLVFAGSTGYMEDQYGNPFTHPHHTARYFTLLELLKRTNINIWEEYNVINRYHFKETLFLKKIKPLIEWWVSLQDQGDLLEVFSRKDIALMEAGRNFSRLALGELSRKTSGVLGDSIPSGPLKSIFHERCHDPVFGLDMYKIIRRSKIALNIHTDVAKNNVGNYRMFDITGVNSCMIMNRGDNLSDLFEAEREVVTYGSLDECVDKANYLLDHEEQRREIAEAGHKRTMKDHTQKARCHQIHGILRERLRTGSGRAVGKKVVSDSPAIMINVVAITNKAVETWINVSLPTQLSSNNLGRLKDAPNIVYTIHARQESADRIESSDVYKTLSKLMTARLETVEQSEAKDPYISKRLEARSMDQAIAASAVFIWLLPEMVFSDGALDTVYKAATAGKVMAMIPDIPVAQEALMQARGEFADNGCDGSVAFTPASLTNMALERLQLSGVARLKSRFGYARLRALLLWRVSAGKMLVRSSLLHPIMINFNEWGDRRIPKARGIYFDHNCAPDSYDLFFPADSAKFLVCSVDVGAERSVIAPPADCSQFQATANYLGHCMRLHVDEPSTVWEPDERSFDRSVGWLLVWLKLRSVIEDIAIVLKALSKRAHRHAGDALEYTRSLPGGPPEEIAILTTARPEAVELVVRKMREAFPGANITLISQKGTPFKENGPLVAPAMPQGKFALRHVFSTWMKARRHVNPDVTVVIYNNPKGEGYFAVKLFALLLGARRTMGIYNIEDAQKIETKQGIGYLFNKLILWTVVYPVATASLLYSYFADKLKQRRLLRPARRRIK